MAVERDVILVDDDELVRRGLGEWLTSLKGIRVVGDAANAADCLALIQRTRPEVALIDVILPGVSGIDLTREIHSKWPSVKCIILSGSTDTELVFDAFQSGASGYLPKIVSADELRLALHQICDKGLCYLSPVVCRPVIERALELRESHAAASSSEDVALSDRERELLKLIAEGHTFSEIATHLDIGPRSVERLKARLEEKTGAENLVDLVRKAIKLGLVNP